MRLATASASPLGSFFFLKMRRIASPVVAPVPPRAGVSIKTHYFVRAPICLRDIERTSPALEAQPSATYIDNESTTLT